MDDIGSVFALIIYIADPVSVASFLSKVLEVISARLALSTYIAAPFAALLFVNVQEKQIKLDYTVANAAPPYVDASLLSKVICVPSYDPSTIITPAPNSAVLCS